MSESLTAINTDQKALLQSFIVPCFGDLHYEEAVVCAQALLESIQTNDGEQYEELKGIVFDVATLSDDEIYSLLDELSEFGYLGIPVSQAERSDPKQYGDFFRNLAKILFLES